MPKPQTSSQTRSTFQRVRKFRADGAGGSAFDVDQFSVTGLDPSAAAVGPLTSASLVDGRTLAAADAGTDVVVLDQTYATSAELAVGDTLAIGGTDFAVVRNGRIQSVTGFLDQIPQSA